MDSIVTQWSMVADTSIVQFKKAGTGAKAEARRGGGEVPQRGVLCPTLGQQ